DLAGLRVEVQVSQMAGPTDQRTDQVAMEVVSGQQIGKGVVDITTCYIHSDALHVAGIPAASILGEWQGSRCLLFCLGGSCRLCPCRASCQQKGSKEYCSFHRRHPLVSWHGHSALLLRASHCAARSGKSVTTPSTARTLNSASCQASSDGQFFGRLSVTITPPYTTRPAALASLTKLLVCSLPFSSHDIIRAAGAHILSA